MSNDLIRREILFRAKRINWYELPKEEWWVEGYLFDDGFPKPKHYFVGGIIVKPYIGTADDEWDIVGIDFYEIDPETLCQFTGMADKNGRMIWENDIVSCEHEKFQEGDAVEQYPFPDTIRYKRNYAVEFINTGSSYGYRLRNKSIHFMLTGNVIYNHKIEVIGNVFDNSELLKGE